MVLIKSDKELILNIVNIYLKTSQFIHLMLRRGSIRPKNKYFTDQIKPHLQ